ARAGKDDDGVDVKATLWSNGTLRGQLDRLETDPDTHRARRVWVGGWSLENERTGRCEGGPVDLTPAVEAARFQYTWADVSQIVQEILRTCGMGAYSLRRSGGVYVCPTNGREMLDRLGRLAESIGLNLLRYDIPDNRAQRDEIAGAIADTLLGDCDAHSAALDGYTPEQTKPGIVENRREAITETRRLADRLATHLGDRALPIRERLDALLIRCQEVAQAVQNYRPTQGGRRIAFASQPAVS
ncbi:MAG: hypothetical protein ACJ8F7_15685, partial [Gemmataceae bacterium]